MNFRFTLRQIQYFVAVAECESIVRASERLNISAPSLSVAVAQLEAAFGLQLFIRKHSQKLALTAEGGRFLHEARQLLAQATNLHRAAGAISDRLQGPFSVGCHVAFSALVLPTVRRRFEVAHAGVAWQTLTADQSALIERLRGGELDVALAFDLGLAEDLAFQPLAALDTHALFAADHPLRQRDAVSLAELANQPLILTDSALGRDYYLGLFAAAGLTPRIVDRVADPDLLRSMVAHGLGYALANVRPLNSAAADGKAVCLKPLSDRHQPLQIGSVSLAAATQPKLIASFHAHCRLWISDECIPGMAPPPRERARAIVKAVPRTKTLELLHSA